MNLKRTIQEWRNLDPVNIAQRQGRPVAKHALVDAKHDILALAARVEELKAAAPAVQGEPDVAGLVSLLEQLLTSGHLPAAWKGRVTEALAAHRKQGGK